ncbi:hypothetical protein [Listeria phage P100plus]|uniref:Uncharacterized protein n=5 Tax=Pecentumvirus TaxID=1857844 RepID=S4U9W8_9CAUD|nr:hypothetical protein QLX35_gp031 [Listeria phage LP-125]YP_406496.1 gp120 [Listeria phage P100]QJB22389.1 hypothetical protein [Listeria phage P100plus]QJB22579.1 hypothetical protein [Listeria phage P200]QNL31974.1 hypothetical protein HUK30_0012 [Listeria phage LP-Mix_6.2]AAY53423.1 gp120 [Listeria phage P100]AGI11353.1 hypothetical protein LP125_028 [Listeria phage LP-125]
MEKLNENQQIVLKWLKNYLLDDSDFYNTVYASKQLYVNGFPSDKSNIAFMKLTDKEFASVLLAFSTWYLLELEKEDLT